MSDGSAPVRVHSLLHTNLNTTDVAAAASCYADVLGLLPGMKTARAAAEGRALGVAGTPVTECWFLYDHRGPRTAPAVEVLMGDPGHHRRPPGRAPPHRHQLPRLRRAIDRARPREGGAPRP